MSQQPHSLPPHLYGPLPPHHPIPHYHPHAPPSLPLPPPPPPPNHPQAQRKKSVLSRLVSPFLKGIHFLLVAHLFTNYTMLVCPSSDNHKFCMFFYCRAYSKFYFPTCLKLFIYIIFLSVLLLIFLNDRIKDSINI